MHLLDVNALIALAWPPHVHHAAAAAWFRQHASASWATCAMTESAFVRILCQPAFAGRAVTVLEATELLRQNIDHSGHRFVSMADTLPDVHARCTGGLVGHRQITDAYLLATAVHHGARLLTFDASVRHLLATDGERSRHLTVLKG